MNKAKLTLDSTCTHIAGCTQVCAASTTFLGLFFTESTGPALDQQAHM